MNKFIDNATFEDANIVVFGVSFNNKADLMLERLRNLNQFIESFDIEKKRDLLKNSKITDIGNVKLSEVTSKIKNIRENKKIPLALGAHHHLSLNSLKAFDENIKLVVFDAHADLKDNFIDDKVAESVEGSDLSDNEKSRFNCTTWLRRYSESKNEKNIILIGLRSCGEEDFKYINENSISYFTVDQIRKNLDIVKNELKKFADNSDVYISIDIDVFDPSIAPAVNHPEPNGLTFKEFSELLNQISDGNIVGIDLVELKSIQGNDVTEFLTIRSLFELLSFLK